MNRVKYMSDKPDVGSRIMSFRKGGKRVCYERLYRNTKEADPKNAFASPVHTWRQTSPARRLSSDHSWEHEVSSNTCGLRVSGRRTDLEQ